jgi:hypothetical protein
MMASDKFFSGRRTSIFTPPPSLPQPLLQQLLVSQAQLDTPCEMAKRDFAQAQDQCHFRLHQTARLLLDTYTWVSSLSR